MRTFLRRLHKWLSLPAGILITIMCLTGAILVFQDEIQELSNPTHYFVKEVKDAPIPLDQLIPMVNAQLDSNTVADVKISADLKRTYTMTLKEGFRVSAFVDQYTGKVTGMYKFRESPFFTIMSLHRWLLDGSRTWGKYTMGISTLLFVFILITGFIVWMPRRFKRSRFKIQFRKGKKRLLYDLHSVLGAYASLILLICALTGLVWSFDWYRNGLFIIFGAEVAKEQPRGNSKKENPEKSELNIANWQKAFDTLKMLNPDYEYIRMQDASAVVHQKSSITSRATDKSKFDPETGEITKTILFKDQEKTTRIWAWVYSLHVGNYWGIWSKIFTCLFALIGASLPLTGYYIFFVKNRNKKRKEVRQKVNVN